jgi:ABC-type transporter Mla MlaB component
MLVVGPALLGNITEVLQQGADQLREGATILDLSEVTELDSSLLAAALAWLRQAKAANRSLTLVNLPAGFTTLAELYGVDGLLAPDSGTVR